ncbi:hypothetical protein Ancab_025547 [Ancistrocladus abbreviatus]
MGGGRFIPQHATGGGKLIATEQVVILKDAREVGELLPRPPHVLLLSDGPPHSKVSTGVGRSLAQNLKHAIGLILRTSRTCKDFQLGTMPVLTSEAVNAPGGLEDFTCTNGDANVSLYKIKPSIRLPDQLQCCRMPSYSCSNLAAAAAFYCCYDRQPPE